VGTVFFADSEAKATTNNRHSLKPGEKVALSADSYADLNPFLRLYDFWADSVEDGDCLVVSYIRDATEPGGGRAVAF